MVGLVRSTRYVLALASPAPPAPLPRSGFVHRPKQDINTLVRIENGSHDAERLFCRREWKESSLDVLAERPPL